jgi:hypothetical protein
MSDMNHLLLVFFNVVIPTVYPVVTPPYLGQNNIACFVASSYGAGTLQLTLRLLSTAIDSKL